MGKAQTKGHILSIITVIIWGTTFISTKVLLRVLSPVEILFLRFVIGFLVLIIFYPKRLKVKSVKKEIYFALAGLSGVTLYYLLENIALTYTFASNVGVIISVSPFFIALLSRIFLKGEKLKPQFFVGFIIALCGICLISFNGQFSFGKNLLGEILAVLAAALWAVYSVLTKKISAFGYQTVPATRRVFGYGLIFMLPALFFMDFSPAFTKILQPVYLLNILFLGIAASAVCFVTWNFAVKTLGAVKTGAYIYAVPAVTVIFSIIFLGEKLTIYSAIGFILTLGGLFVSEVHFKKPKKK